MSVFIYSRRSFIKEKQEDQAQFIVKLHNRLEAEQNVCYPMIPAVLYWFTTQCTLENENGEIHLKVFAVLGPIVVVD